jgi:hypothetical protein
LLILSDKFDRYNILISLMPRFDDGPVSGGSFPLVVVESPA